MPEVHHFEDEVPDRLNSLAKQLRIPGDILKQAYEAFTEICTTLDHPMAVRGRRTGKKGEILDDGIDVFKDGEVNIDGFAKIICKLVGCSLPSELPDGLVQRSFRDAVAGATKSLAFLDFAMWYSRSRDGSTEQHLLMTSAQLAVHEVARKHDLPVLEVEQYKKKFDFFDEDQSGQIDYQEFTKLLNSLIKVPAHVELPRSRVNQFWLEADRDRNNFLSFEEFVLFFDRYFNISGATSCPFEEYYRGLRRVPR